MGAALASNVDAFKVRRFDDEQAVLPARRLTTSDRSTALREFRRRQGADFHGRARFEELWTGGRELVYGAVTLDGPGVLDYGIFCLVWPAPPATCGVFPVNTGRDYVGVDASAVRADAALWQDKHHVVVLARGSAALLGRDEDQSEAVCSSAGFVEANVVGPFPLATVLEVRVPASELRRLRQLQARALGDPTSLTPREASELTAYRTLRRRARRGALDILAA